MPEATDEAKGFRSGTFFWGVVLIAAGIAFLFEAIEIGEAVSRWWPLFVIAMGIRKLIEGRPPGSGLTVIAIGTWLLISHLGLFGLTWSSSWPLLLIGVGVAMVVQFLVSAAAERSRATEPPHE